MKKKKLSNEQIGAFALAMSHLLQGGISAANAMVFLEEDEQDPCLKELWNTMARSLDGGSTLASALRQSGRFPAYVCTLMEVGQRTGKVQQTLEALTGYYRDRARLERQLRSALVYPAVLLAVLLAVVMALLIWVLPVFDKVYAQLGAGLKGISGWLLDLGSTIKAMLPWIVGGLVLLGTICSIPTLRRNAMNLARKIWGDWGTLRKINAARFVQALWLCVSSGMTVPEAAEMAASLAETPAFLRRCNRCREAAEQGNSLSESLRAAEMLQPSQCRLLEAGERSGRSEQVLETVSRDLLEAAEEKTVRMVSAVEPVMVTICSVLIGMVLLAVLLPLLNIMASIG